jgi:hypothetical protein
MAPHHLLQRRRQDGRQICRGGPEGDGPRSHPLHRWIDHENIERYGVEIIADEVTFPSHGKSRQQQQGAAQDNEDDDITF